ncbi:MAG: hypothetical protein E7365_04900 [Clostridiales bacterium]|nr:hypothetical protein [Clostridiales bacterium]
MIIFGIYIELYIVIILGAIIALLLSLIILSIIKSDKTVKDVDERENFGNFSGLLSKEDFEFRADHPLVETYRMQWIKAAPGDLKDTYLLFYLAIKQLMKEQDETDEEWSQEKCESRMDEIVNELSEKTGIKVSVDELPETEFDMYFEEDSETTEDNNEVDE